MQQNSSARTWENNHLCTCHIVSNSHCGERDHNKVDGFQCGPALNMFENDGWNGDKNNAASQDEQDGGRHSDLSLADLLVLLLTKNKYKIILELLEAMKKGDNGLIKEKK